MHHAGAGGAPWQGPAPAQRILREFITLRRRLTPYVESSGASRPVDTVEARGPFAAASLDGYSRSLHHLHAFEFGPAFWVQPVPPVATDALRVVLPAGPAWVDFWTGAHYAGDQVVRTPAPLDLIPAFVRGGSIVPLALVNEQSGEFTDTLEIRVFPGADGDFVLQEGCSAGAKGACGRIPFYWNEAKQELRIGARSGEADPGTVQRRRFEVVIVRPGGIAGHNRLARPNYVVDYLGEEIRLSMPPAAVRPSAPRGLAATIQGGRVVLTWDAPSASPVYRLKRVLGPGGVYEDIASALLHPRHAIPLAECGGTFDCVVTAMNAGGESEPSAPLRVTLPGGATKPERAASTHFAKAV